MDKTDFQIVFNKLTGATSGSGAETEWAILSETACEELDEIAELRRLSDQLSAPDVSSYTTT